MGPLFRLSRLETRLAYISKKAVKPDAAAYQDVCSCAYQQRLSWRLLF
jgi:hypothetical protein